MPECHILHANNTKYYPDQVRVSLRPVRFRLDPDTSQVRTKHLHAAREANVLVDVDGREHWHDLKHDSSVCTRVTTQGRVRGVTASTPPPAARIIAAIPNVHARRNDVEIR